MTFEGDKYENDGRVVYNPQMKYAGYTYYFIGRILFILWESLPDDPEGTQEQKAMWLEAKRLIDECLTLEPRGLGLRNEYLLPIRVNLQDFKTDTSRAQICKRVLTNILDDTVVPGGILPPEALSLKTQVAVDYSRLNSERLVLEGGIISDDRHRNMG